MFNHSCDPNVDWRHDEHNSTVTLFATRDITVGEEMCISYIKGADMGRRERQRSLMTWLGMDCACQRCVDETAAEEKVFEDGRKEDGVVDERVVLGKPIDLER